MRIAFLGLGRMGRPMAANLVAAGHDVVVWNRTAAVADSFVAEHAAATTAASPAEAVRDVEVVVTMLADDAAVVATYDGDDGVLAGLAGATDVVAIDMSTVSPPTVTDLAARLRDAGHALVDAPVSGSVPAATAATLTIMAAGDTAAVDRALPVLESLGATVVRVGASGGGAAMKLALNSVLHALNAGISEALVLTERVGIERSAAYDVLAASVVAAPYVHYKRAAFEDPDAAPAAFLLRLAAKDLRLALELADRVGTAMPQARTNLAGVEAAAAAGYGERDMSALAAHLRTLPAPSTAQETAP